MSLEANLPPEHDVGTPPPIAFMGHAVQVRRLKAYDVNRLVKLFNLVRVNAGIAPADYQRALDFDTFMKLGSAILGFASNAIDLDKEDLSMEAHWVYQELGRYIVWPPGSPYEANRPSSKDIATEADLDDMERILTRLFEQEREGALGKRVRAIVGALMSQLTTILGRLKSRPPVIAGGMAGGGTIGSTTRSEAPTDGPTTTSSAFPSAV